jgi:HSP20 family molecular chaperone IbpA
MAAMRLVGSGHTVSARAYVREAADQYVIELEVSDFAEPELTIETLGSIVTVRGDQLEQEEDEGEPFRIHEQLVEWIVRRASTPLPNPPLRVPHDDVERMPVGLGVD